MAVETVRLRIEGMGCDGCVAAVDDALRTLPGVTRVDVDLAAGTAEVELERPADPAPLLAAIAGAGYDAAVA
jgi:copper chaperone CopZ